MPEKGQEETVRIVALDRSFHVGCYVCEVSQEQEVSSVACCQLEKILSKKTPAYFFPDEEEMSFLLFFFMKQNLVILPHERRQ